MHVGRTDTGCCCCFLPKNRNIQVCCVNLWSLLALWVLSPRPPQADDWTLGGSQPSFVPSYLAEFFYPVVLDLEPTSESPRVPPPPFFFFFNRIVKILFFLKRHVYVDSKMSGRYINIYQDLNVLLLHDGMKWQFSSLRVRLVAQLSPTLVWPIGL